VVEVLDAGLAYNNGRPPETIRFDGEELPNPRKHAPPQSMLGAEQKAWFLARLRESTAPWKLWGNSVAMLDWRIDFQNLPPDLGPLAHYWLRPDRRRRLVRLSLGTR